MSEDKKELLVVVSKLKKYIKAEAGMNTSASVAEVLTSQIQELCKAAISNAQSEGRKTVMDRDFEAASCAKPVASESSVSASVESPF